MAWGGFGKQLSCGHGFRSLYLAKGHRRRWLESLYTVLEVIITIELKGRIWMATEVLGERLRFTG